MTTTTRPSVTAPVAIRRTGVLARAWRLTEVRWATAATALFVAGLAVRLAGGPETLAWTLFLGCYAAGGWEPGLAGLRALRDRTLDVDLLMVVAAIGAAAIGQVLDGALLIVIFATSGALEAVATARTADAVRDLLDLAPDTATRLTPGGQETVPAADLRTGEVILVRPGERIAADGTVIDGASEVDQATITGEPLPADKAIGDEVFAGTANGTGALRVRVTRPAHDTVVARIVAMVEEASRTKAATQLFIERIEQRYSLAMVTATLALFTLPLLFGAELRGTLLRAMTFMIVASPCAVVLATMPPLLAAMANASRHGVLVKSATVMERLGHTTLVAFDKTGTLTQGTPHLTKLNLLLDVEPRELLGLAASAEESSQHPLGRAIVAAAREEGLAVVTAREFSSEPGRGVRAKVGGRLVEIGAPARLLPEGDAATKAVVAECEAAGLTAVLMLLDGVPAAVFGLADAARPEAAEAVAALTSLTGAVPVLLTGDNPRAATALANQIGLGGDPQTPEDRSGRPPIRSGRPDHAHLGDDPQTPESRFGRSPIRSGPPNRGGITGIRAGLLPQDKVTAVRSLQQARHQVLLVGDGVNDAPALAAADTGIAMGQAGSDLALDAADAVIIRDDLSTLPAVIALSRRARRLITANLAIAATFIAVLSAWDLFGTLPLPLGVLGHEGSTLIVALNGLRLLRPSAWPHPHEGGGALDAPARGGITRREASSSGRSRWTGR